MQGLQVLFEDNHLIAVNKPAGMLVQGDITEDKPMSEFVKQYIADRYNKPGAVFLGTIHRLDRPVSGVVIYARTSKALARMNALFQKREIQKTYWAITEERPDPLSGHLVHYIDKDRTRNVAHASVRPRNKDAKKSELDYELIAEVGNHHLLKVNPLTGSVSDLPQIEPSIRRRFWHGFSSSSSSSSFCCPTASARKHSRNKPWHPSGAIKH